MVAVPDSGRKYDDWTRRAGWGPRGSTTQGSASVSAGLGAPAKMLITFALLFDDVALREGRARLGGVTVIA